MTEALYEIAKKIRYDATAIQGKVTDLLNLLNELEIPDRPKTLCPSCGIQLAGPVTLAAHMENVHGQYESERLRSERTC